MLVTYDVPLGGLAQQAAEGDDGGHAGAVEEEHRGQALQAQRVPDVAPQERGLAPHVRHHAAKQPAGGDAGAETDRTDRQTCRQADRQTESQADYNTEWQNQ